MTGGPAGKPAAELGRNRKLANRQTGCVLWRTGPLTAVDAQMFLQVMFVLESFSTLATFELAVSSFTEQRQLQRENTRVQTEKQAVTAADLVFSKGPQRFQPDVTNRRRLLSGASA